MREKEPMRPAKSPITGIEFDQILAQFEGIDCGRSDLVDQNRCILGSHMISGSCVYWDPDMAYFELYNDQ